MFYGFSFGLGGLGAAALGKLADLTSITTVYRVCPFLLLLGLMNVDLSTRRLTRYGFLRARRATTPLLDRFGQD
jgi:hypothetical protein